MFMPSGAVAAAGASQESIEFITCGTNGNQVGFFRGFYGSIAPDDPVLRLGLYQGVTTFSTFEVRIQPINIPNTDISWKQVDLIGDFGGGPGETQTYLRKDFINYNPNGGFSDTEWDFTLQSQLILNEIYEVIIST